MMYRAALLITLVLAACSNHKNEPDPEKFSLTAAEREKLAGCEIGPATLKCPASTPVEALNEVEASIDRRRADLRGQAQADAHLFLLALIKERGGLTVVKAISAGGDAQAKVRAITEGLSQTILGFQCLGGSSAGPISATLPFAKEPIEVKNEVGGVAWTLGTKPDKRVVLDVREDAVSYLVSSSGEWTARASTPSGLAISCLKSRASGPRTEITDPPVAKRRVYCQSESFYLEKDQRRRAVWSVEFTIGDGAEEEEVAAPRLADTVYAKLKYGVLVKHEGGRLRFVVHEGEVEKLSVQTANSAPTVSLSYGRKDADQVRVVCLDAP